MTRSMRNGGLALTILALAVGSASAAQVDMIGGNVGQTFVFDSTLPVSGQWTVGSTLSGASAFDAGFSAYYEVGSNFAPATFSWTGNPLVGDLSAGGLAHGVFGGGGTLTITGKLFNVLGGGVEVFDGVLLTGSVSGFEVVEPVDAPSFLDVAQPAVFTPISGALVDGSFGLEMTSPYYLTFTGALAQHVGGDDLVDFSDDIVTIASFQWNMFPVPEPATGLVLVAGIALLSARRRA